MESSKVCNCDGAKSARPAARILLRASPLAAINLFGTLEGVGFVRRLVGTEADDSREAQGVSAFVAVGFHHVVERHLEHDLRFDLAAESLIVEGVLQEPLRH